MSRLGQVSNLEAMVVMWEKADEGLFQCQWGQRKVSRFLRVSSGRMTRVDEVHMKWEGDKGMKNDAKFPA